MRQRERILGSLESAYREAFERARDNGLKEEMERLDFDFQREQIRLEVLLDIRELLLPVKEEAHGKPTTSLIDEGTALVEKAQALRRITRLR
jgi:hypothetical protein